MEMSAIQAIKLAIVSTSGLSRPSVITLMWLLKSRLWSGTTDLPHRFDRQVHLR